MSFSNDFLPFATGGGANVESQGSYAAEASRSSGFQSGKASSLIANKVFRQGNFVASMIAQFTADFGPGNVLDDGVIANMEAQFEAALRTYLSGYFLPFAPASTYYISTSGSDTLYDGTSATISGSHGPWATIQHAIITISKYQSQNTITLNVAAGTYTVNAGGFAAVVESSQIAAWNIIGSGVSSCNIDASASGARGFVAHGGTVVTVTGFSVKSYYEAFLAGGSGANLTVGSANVQLVGTQSNAFAAYDGGFLIITGPSILINGVGGFGFYAFQGNIRVGYHDINTTYSVAIDLSSPTVTAVVGVTVGGTIHFYSSYVSWSGSLAGLNWIATANGVIDTDGSATTWIPGTLGSTASGGQYV